MNMASYPNKQYICCVCGKDLGSRRKRLLNPNTAKNVNKIKEKIYCDKHYEDSLDNHVLYAPITDEEIFLQRELLNCNCGAYKIATDGEIMKVADCIC